MSHRAEDLYEAAVALPEPERAVLVVKLLDSIGGGPEVTEAQTRESASRLVAMKAGELALVDHDEALRLIGE